MRSGVFCSSPPIEIGVCRLRWVWGGAGAGVCAVSVGGGPGWGVGGLGTTVPPSPTPTPDPSPQGGGEKNQRIERRAFLAGAIAASFAPRPAAAQAYPARPVTLVIPFPPGGGNDALGRMVADKMSKSLGQQIVVDNRGGAGGTIATGAVARSTPDGYTILLAYTGTLAINPSLYANPGYDPRKDFAPIGLIAGLPSELV